MEEKLCKLRETKLKLNLFALNDRIVTNNRIFKPTKTPLS